MQAGDEVKIKAKVLRVDGNRVDAQTPSGQLIQTDVANVETASVKEIKTPIAVAGGAIEHNAKAAGKGKATAGSGSR